MPSNNPTSGRDFPLRLNIVSEPVRAIQITLAKYVYIVSSFPLLAVRGVDPEGS